MKSCLYRYARSYSASSLMRGTWIEIDTKRKSERWVLSSLMRGTWIEMVSRQCRLIISLSSLMRGTWIEINFFKVSPPSVVCRPSCEGRGLKSLVTHTAYQGGRRPSCEGRGLKLHFRPLKTYLLMSSLMRGTWIEMLYDSQLHLCFPVVPHARDVD